ncbi:MAG: DUF4926 domain-containing protein [Sideroxydans sp.]|nr:DUF4926 domain-containing protein [Sideroxydans sp.]
MASKLKMLDVVSVTAALPELGLNAGMLGTIVEVFTDEAFEVEFCNDNGETIVMLPLKSSQIELYASAHF